MITITDPFDGSQHHFANQIFDDSYSDVKRSLILLGADGEPYKSVIPREMPPIGFDLTKG